MHQVARLPDAALTTWTEYDLRGNVPAIVEPVNRRAFENFYDLANRALRTESIDAGWKRFVFDAAGNGIERRDAKGALTLTTCDHQNQPQTLWARDDGTAKVTLRQRFEYGDATLPEADARARNLPGKPWRASDEAGRVETERVDSKGNGLESVRRVISGEALTTLFAGADLRLCSRSPRRGRATRALGPVRGVLRAVGRAGVAVAPRWRRHDPAGIPSSRASRSGLHHAR